MTFILQALERDEEDRRAGAVGAHGRPDRSRHLPGDPAARLSLVRLRQTRRTGGVTAPTWRPLWLWLVAVGLGFVFGVVFVVGRPSGVAVVAPPPGTGERAEASSAPAAGAQPRETTAAGLHQPGRAAATAPKVDTTLAMVPPTAPARPTPPPPAQPAASAPAIASERPPDPRQPLWGNHRQAAVSRERWLETEEEPKAESEVSTLRIEMLVWAADPEKRMIYMNGRKYVQGEALESGTVIEQIVEDGVVLVHQGQRIWLPSEAR
jgi:Type II secretion system protein B